MKSYPQIPTSLLFLLIVIAVVNAVAEVYHWYWTMRWFDIPMHFSGGMWLAGMALWWVYFRKGVTPRGFLALWGVSVVAAFGIGFLWEGYEAVISFATVGHMNNLLDTLGDLLFDILGGTTVAILVHKRELFKSK